MNELARIDTAITYMFQNRVSTAIHDASSLFSRSLVFVLIIYNIIINFKRKGVDVPLNSNPNHLPFDIKQRVTNLCCRFQIHDKGVQEIQFGPT